MVDKDTVDLEDTLVRPGEMPKTLAQLKEEFEFKRRDDDEFARDYRKGEFFDWLNAEGYSVV